MQLSGEKYELCLALVDEESAAARCLHCCSRSLAMTLLRLRTSFLSFAYDLLGIHWHARFAGVRISRLPGLRRCCMVFVSAETATPREPIVLVRS